MTVKQEDHREKDSQDQLSKNPSDSKLKTAQQEPVRRYYGVIPENHVPDVRKTIVPGRKRRAIEELAIRRQKVEKSKSFE